MSPVLRPLSAVKKNSESVVNNIPEQIVPEVVSEIVIPSLVTDVDNNLTEITEGVVNSGVAHASTEQAEVVVPTSQEEIIKEETVEEEITEEEQSKEEKKEEKISAVLQEILDRKIDKAIISAEASLGNLVPLEVTKTEESINITPPLSEAIVLPVTSDVTAPTQDISPEIVKAPGQEIHISAPVQVESPVVNQVTITPEVMNHPVVSNINVIPVHVTTQEILPVITSVEQTTLPVTNPVNPLPVQQLSAVSAQLAVPEQKIHWFDRLFGSVPKTP